MRSSWVYIVIIVTSIISSVPVRGSLSDRETEDVIDSARVYAMEADDLLRRRHEAGLDIRAEEFHRVEPGIFEGSPEPVNEISRLSRLINHIGSQIRSKELNTTVEDVLESDAVGETHPDLACPFRFHGECDGGKYRSLDGSCNNQKHPLRGAALTPFPRDLVPQYGEAAEGEEAYAAPRTLDSEGNPLPSPREISMIVHQAEPDKDKNKNDINFLFTFWGQFMAHMVAHRAVASGSNGSRIDCCSQSLPTPGHECFNIPMSDADPFRERGTTCLRFLRSLEATDINCKYGRREQLNWASSFIDGSAVYGNDVDLAHFLRAFEGGLMAVSEPDQLPFRAHVNQIAAKSGFGFVAAGDPRAPVVAPLTGMHTIWVREHNRIARGLGAVNPDWDDQTLYQEARRIIVAMIQHVTYKEWLPLLLGSKLYKKHDLEPRKQDKYFKGYDKTVDASTRNEVATGAFRFGHSLVKTEYPLVNKRFEVTSPAVTLVEMFFRPNVYLTNEQNLMRGLLSDAAPAMDASLTPQLTSELFKIHAPHGDDLAALNIQRGRDHGLPSYNAWRKKFKLSQAKEFKTGSGGFKNINKATVKRLQSVYKSPDDVDLWVGGVSETSAPGGVVGPLFANMLGRQFSRCKRGDRFWYETDEKPQAFTKDQLVEIRRTTFSRILCNTYDLETIQLKAFQISKKNNPLVDCEKLPNIDLDKWKDGPVLELKSLVGNDGK